MHIKKVTIRHWRGLELFEAELSPGLNLVRGRNEAGKSSVVEAISWALHRDVVGSGQIKAEIVPIIPANAPRSKPSVEVELAFPDCTASIHKTLAEDAAGRQCTLTIRRAGLPDIQLVQEQAQNELHRLIGSGAYGGGDGAGVDVPLLISQQEKLVNSHGKRTHFIEEELSSAARSGIALSSDGVLTASARLQKVRQTLDKQAKKEFLGTLKVKAVESARKQTEAEQTLNSLNLLREEQAHFAAIDTQIDDVRGEINQLLQKQQRIEPAIKSTSEQWETQRARREAQLLADGEVTEKRRVLEAAGTARDEWHRRCDDILRLRTESTRVAAEKAQLEAQLAAARQEKEAADKATSTAWETSLAAEKDSLEARRVAVAWDRYLEVSNAHRERNRLRKQWENIQEQLREASAKKLVLDGVESAPAPSQLSNWHRIHHEIETMRRAAAQTLQITVRLEREVCLQFQPDDGEAQSSEATADEEIVFASQTRGVLRIDGLGEISVSSTGREAQKQDAEIESKLRTLEKELKPFGWAPADLPEALETAQERIEAREAATQLWQLSAQKLESLLGGEEVETYSALLNEASEAYELARSAAEEFRAVIPEGIKQAQANLERERARTAENAAREAAEAAQREWRRVNNRSMETATAVTALETRLQAAEQAEREGAARLLELTRDGLEDEARAQELEQLRHSAYRAQEELNAAGSRREALGEAVEAETVGHLQYEAGQWRQRGQDVANELADKRATLRGYCEQDPQTRLNELEEEICEREVELVRHEARLRGMAVLRAALEAQQHRLGRAIAGPLNAQLSPWLSTLRERPTRVEFDENTGQLTRVQTTQGDDTFLLPFKEHSGGMQEQAALALRLILALSAARHLPGGRLPLVLDDPLTQTDSLRREGLWRVLDEAGEHLQIVFVTCHEAHLPVDLAANITTVGEWPMEKEPEVILPAKPSRNRENGSGNGRASQKDAPRTLSLW